jgi:hypothetical protein
MNERQLVRRNSDDLVLLRDRMTALTNPLCDRLHREICRGSDREINETW